MAARAEQVAESEALLRAELAAQSSAMAARAEQVAESEALLRAELAAQSSAMAARQGEQVQQLETIMHARHAEQSAQQVATAQREQAMAGRHDELHDQMVRSLALTRTWHSARLPRELRGINRLIHKKTRRLARDYRVVACSPLFDRDWYLKTNPDVAERGEILYCTICGKALPRGGNRVQCSTQGNMPSPTRMLSRQKPILSFISSVSASMRGARSGWCVNLRLPLRLPRFFFVTPR
jgi:hypothetical protein